MNTLFKKTLLIIATASLGLASNAFAQTNDPAKAPKFEFTNKDADDNAKVFGKWATTCEKNPNNDKEQACFASQTMVLKDKNVEVLYIAIGKLPEIPEPVLAITTPLRTFLPSGIKIQIDDNEEQTLPHEFCDKSGCHLRVGIKQDVVDAMKNGSNINIKFRDALGQQLAIPVSLSGFTKAFDSL